MPCHTVSLMILCLYLQGSHSFCSHPEHRWPSPHCSCCGQISRCGTTHQVLGIWSQPFPQLTWFGPWTSHGSINLPYFLHIPKTLRRAYLLVEGFASFACSHSSSLRARKPWCSSMKSETMIPPPFPFGFILFLPFSLYCSVWSSLDW